MTDCHDDILAYYKERVRLSQAERGKLDAARETVTKGVAAGLLTREALAPERFVPQGSVTMGTVVQHPENDYDIDCGVVLDKANIVGSRGGDKTPRAARQMVAEAFKDERFSEPPEVIKNCVRFKYRAGYHVDMPVYRVVPWFLSKRIEIASGDEWVPADPEGVTAWFTEANTRKSPNSTDDGQFRRVVCLLKAVSKTRTTYDASWPSGVVLSKLVYECYSPDRRDDAAFLRTLRAIERRLAASTAVAHPVNQGNVANEGNAKVVYLRDRIVGFGARLSELEGDCARGRAMTIWGQIFGDSEWFKARLESTAVAGLGAALVTPTSPFQRPTTSPRWG